MFTHLIRALLVSAAVVVAAPPGFPWGGTSHEQGTSAAIAILQSLFPADYQKLFTSTALECVTPYDRYGPVLYDRYAGTPPSGHARRLAWEVKATDHYLDLEFVNVEGVGEGRDDPHLDNMTVGLNCDDYGGAKLVDERDVGRGIQSHLFDVGDGGRYTLRYEVTRGPSPYELNLRLIDLKCESEQSWRKEAGDSDEVYILVNGRRAWRHGDVDRGDTFTLNRTVAFFFYANMVVYEEDDGPCPIAVDDVAHHLEEDSDFISRLGSDLFGLGGKNFTAFSHFIDITKGRGIYNDYDGYSFSRGSARLAGDERSAGDSIDGWVNWWYNDEYVHTFAYYPTSYDPHRCSPAVSRYTFYTGGDVRGMFPLANATGAAGAGIPYTVFLPVDNMAQYWWDEFLRPPVTGRKRNLASLGPVLHAIQDASVPHHAYPCLGNYHRGYESGLTDRMSVWLADSTFRAEVEALVRAWDRLDPSPPATYTYYERAFYLGRTPARNWPVDQLVTWMAVQSWNAMNPPRNYDEAVARPLVQKALALSVLVLRKAALTVPG